VTNCSPFQSTEKKTDDTIKLVEKWDFSLSKKEDLETTEEYLNKCRTISFTEISPGDEVFIKLKKKPKLSLKDPQSIKAHGGGGGEH
jgi:hypothetical protein